MILSDPYIVYFIITLPLRGTHGVVAATNLPFLHQCYDPQSNESEMLVPIWEHFERASV